MDIEIHQEGQKLKGLFFCSKCYSKPFVNEINPTITKIQCDKCGEYFDIEDRMERFLKEAIASLPNEYFKRDLETRSYADEYANE